jgi:mercuric ion transport protein
MRDQQTVGRGWIRSLALIPGAVLPLLPSATCPACIAAYAGVLSAFGLGFLFTERVLAPLTAVFLVIGLASVAWATRAHRSLGPLALAVVGSAGVAAGRLVWSIQPLLYAGVALLVFASLWNLRLKRPRPVPLVQLGLHAKSGGEG